MRTAQTDSATKQKLLDAAQELMLAKGYTATSAGLTKGSFFLYFDGKEDLGKEVAERFFAGMRESMQSATFVEIEDPLERVLGFVDFLIAKARNPRLANGCLLGMFVQELSETHPKIRNACAACFSKQSGWLAVQLEEAKAKYVPRARWDPNTLAEHLIAVAQGSIILAKAKRERRVIEESLVHYKEYLRALFSR